MQTRTKKIMAMLLTVMLLLAVATPVAASQLSLVFNGQPVVAELQLSQGVTTISTDSLAALPGVEVSEKGAVPLRQFFESRGASVTWDDATKTITVTMAHPGGFTPDELVVKSTEVLKELNTYRLAGSGVMQIEFLGDMAGMPAIPEMTITQEGVFRQQPLAMHFKQAMTMPVPEGFELSEKRYSHQTNLT